MSQKAKARWKLILNLVTFIALIAMVYILRHQILESLSNLGRVNAWALLLMVPFQYLNYHAYTQQYRAILNIFSERIRYRSMFRVVLELNFINNVFPSGGVSGFSYFSLRMKDAEVSGAKASLTHLLRFILVFIAFQIFLLVGLVMLAIGGQANGLVLLVSGSLATLILVGTLGIGVVIGSKRRIHAFFGFVAKVLNKIIHVVRPKHPETINMERAEKTFEELHENYMVIQKDYSVLKQPLKWSLLANLTEVLTVYTVYVAFGHWVNPGAVILAYAVANFAGFISVLPGGVGIYEALMTAVLAACGIPPGLSIPVTVMYRVLNSTIQLPPGWVLYHRRIRQLSP